MRKTSPGAYRAMLGLETYLHDCAIEYALIKLVKIRASQINGCAFCLAMHVHDARKRGETDDRMHLLNAWRETAVFSARERAALAWTEVVTLVADSHVPDDAYEEARREFSEKELVDLTLVVTTINAWNRLAVAFRWPPEHVQTPDRGSDAAVR